MSDRDQDIYLVRESGQTRPTRYGKLTRIIWPNDPNRPDEFKIKFYELKKGEETFIGEIDAGESQTDNVKRITEFFENRRARRGGYLI